MICPKCGKQIEDDAVFCTYCGNNMTDVQEEKAITPPQNHCQTH